MVSQLHQLLLELIPGGAKKDLSAAQAKALLTKVRPRDEAGKARRRVAAELIADLERVYQRKKAADKELKALVAATGTTLMTCTESARPARPSCWSRSPTSPDSRTAPTSPPGTAPHRSTPPPATRSASACPRPGTGRSTAPCTSWPPSSCATPPKDGPTSTEEGRRQDLQRSHARAETKAVRHRLSAHGRRRDHQHGDGPGRTRGNVTCLQRDRLTFPHRLFGSVTSRTRHRPAYDPSAGSLLTQRGAMTGSSSRVNTRVFPRGGQRRQGLAADACGSVTDSGAIESRAMAPCRVASAGEPRS